MINTNKDIEKGLANGTLARFLGVKLKNDDESKIKEKNIDGYKVNTICIENVEYILCEHWEGKKQPDGSVKAPKKFIIKPESDSYIISLVLHNQRVKIKSNIQQFGVLINNATTGHKLQGMSKDNLVVTDYMYNTINWVYVVLSRVRTLKGLFLKKHLDPTKYFINDPYLVEEEERLLEVEKRTLDDIDLQIYYHPSDTILV